MYSERVKAKRDAGINVVFLSFAQSTHHYVGSGPDRLPAVEHFPEKDGFILNPDDTYQFSGLLVPFPSPHKLRYQAYAGMSYGARGIYWFSFGQPWDGYPTVTTPDLNETGWKEVCLNSPANNDEIYAMLSMVNDEIRWIGNVLVLLEWQETIHAVVTDPESTEPELRTLSDSQDPDPENSAPPTYLGEVIKNISEDFALAPSLMISHFQHPLSQQNYLLLFNKSGAGQHYERYYYYDVTNTNPDHEPGKLKYDGGNLISSYIAGSAISFPLALDGNLVIRRKEKNSPGWKKVDTDYDSGANITTCNISLDRCEGLLISLAYPPS